MKPRPWLRPLLLGIPLVLLTLVAVAGGYLWWTVRSAWPQVSGTLQVPGLEAPVEVLRDEWGVPHIYARSDRDLYFAQGYVHAQDRLWQMDYQRRIGMARLSEIFGDPALSTDKFLRTIGTNRAAVADVAHLDPDSRAMLDAYSTGVNAFIATHQDRLPLEFLLLDYKPDPWQPSDTAAWVKMMQWDLSANWEDELFRARVVAELGAGRAAALVPGYPSGAPLIVPREVNAYRDFGVPRAETLASSLEWAGLGLLSWQNGLGSNNWVVSGEKSATGRPILADDLHLGIRIPSIWYEVGLHSPTHNVVGASLPGVPGVVVGHNDHIAWGVTSLAVDVQDLYLEKLNPAQPSEYEVDGEFEPLQVVREEIRVKGQEQPVVLDVRLGRHGALLNDVFEGLEQPTAFRWLAVERPSTILNVVGPMNRASNWREFTAALRDWDIPAQNFVYADTQGNIGYYGAGLVPVRTRGDGQVPVPGWNGRYRWDGFIPFEALPHAFNPPEGFIATANNKPVDDDYPFFLGSSWSAPYRQERIVALLTSRDELSLQDMRDIQADVVSLPARRLAPLLLDVQSDNLIVQRAQEQLREWHERGENRMVGDYPGAGIYQATYEALVRHLFSDELGEELLEEYLRRSTSHHIFVGALLDEPESEWWDDTTTPEQESRDEILARALDDMALGLGRRYGDVPHEWWWRRLHPAIFDHPLGRVEPLGRIFNRTYANVSGDGQTAFATGFNYADSFAVRGLPSYRQIIDVGAWDNSLAHHTTGQSGQPFHPHYDDMIEPWAAVELHRLRFSRAAVEAASEGRLLILEPAE